ncbi:unnamed protein product [Diatraea saccharalis]|uniref:Uncharacterized protein n=1 Tax=Diatraea saccharalis TaxID=40085 RepID=A0A9N9QY15_9NEOP|nr:unnamed protein product [Diatraea saccharalis]
MPITSEDEYAITAATKTTLHNETNTGIVTFNHGCRMPNRFDPLRFYPKWEYLESNDNLFTKGDEKFVCDQSNIQNDDNIDLTYYMSKRQSSNVIIWGSFHRTLLLSDGEKWLTEHLRRYCWPLEVHLYGDQNGLSFMTFLQLFQLLYPGEHVARMAVPLQWVNAETMQDKCNCELLLTPNITHSEINEMLEKMEEGRNKRECTGRGQLDREWQKTVRAAEISLRKVPHYAGNTLLGTNSQLDVDPILRAARHARQMQDISHAADLYFQLVADRPRGANEWRELSSCLMDIDKDWAQVCINKSLSLDPRHRLTLLSKASRLYDDDPAAAEIFFEAILTLYPFWSTGWVVANVYYVKRKMFHMADQLAEICLSRGVAESGETAAFYHLVALCCRLRGDVDDALCHLQIAIDKFGDHTIGNEGGDSDGAEEQTGARTCAAACAVQALKWDRQAGRAWVLLSKLLAPSARREHCQKMARSDYNIILVSILFHDEDKDEQMVANAYPAGK